MNGFRFSTTKMRRNRKLTRGRMVADAYGVSPKDALVRCGAINIEGIKISTINNKQKEIMEKLHISGDVVFPSKKIKLLVKEINNISNRILRRQVFYRLKAYVPVLSKKDVWV